MSDAVLYFDGACEPVNPGGLIAYGWLLESKSGCPFNSDYGIEGAVSRDNTCNVAEYTALIAGLEAALDDGLSSLEVRGDSKLVIKQMRGSWGCHSERLRPLYERAWDLARELESVRFQWIPREQNAEADELTKEAYREFEQR